jgi:hypothetical protein
MFAELVTSDNIREFRARCEPLLAEPATTPARRRRPDVFNAATRPAPRRSTTTATPPVPAPPVESILPRRVQVQRAAAAEFHRAGGENALGVDEASYIQTRLIDEHVIDLAGVEIPEPVPAPDRSLEREIAAIAACKEFVDNGGEEKLHCTRDEWVRTALIDGGFEPL